MEDVIRIESIRERDMDLLILEEIHSSLKFRDLLYSKIGNLREHKFIGAWHSFHSFNLGESDIALQFSDENKSILVLIENKVDASFRKGQLNRYQQRADLHVENNDCDEAYVLLIAPENYLKNVASLENKLSYEEIKQYFKHNDESNKYRNEYKSLVLEYAIEKKRRGYSPEVDEHVTQFQHKYYELSNELFPKLKMRKPKEKVPSGSGFLYFAPIDFPKKISLVHKFIAKGEFNFLDIQFTSQRNLMEQFEVEYKPQLPPYLSIEPANKSFVVRKRISKINIHESFEDQRNQLVESLKELNELYVWFLENYKFEKSHQ